MATDFLAELNDSQREAVVYTDGPLLVIAGAGSGKTRVLTYKIAYLLEEKGMAPWNILALTFTNKAAREMQDRIARCVGKELASRLWMGTFHSIFSRILRTEAQVLGFTSSYTIYDQADSRSLLKTLIKEMGLDEKTYKPATVQNHISLAKNRLIGPEAYIRDAQVRKADEAARIPLTGEIYRRYCQRCRSANAMDFDDLLFNTYVLFRDHPDVCARYADRFRYVLVDEYQDTNYAQHEIVWLLTKEHQQVCAVGDDAQSIYSFRGANIDNILHFQEIYRKKARVLQLSLDITFRQLSLDTNYRSREKIVSAANSLIAQNTKQIPKESVKCPRGKGEPIQVYRTYSDLEEVYIVVNKIKELHAQHDYAYNDIAILYRTNGQSRIFEDGFRKMSIPYRIYGGLSFYQRKEVKDAIAYLRLVVNPDDEEAFKRIVNYPARGIGQTTLDKIGRASLDYGTSLWSVACEPNKFGLNLNKGTLAKLQGFCQLIKDFKESELIVEADVLIEQVLKESGMIHEIYQSTAPEDVARQDNVQELMNGVIEFVAGRKEEGRDKEVFLKDFLQEVSLLTDMDEDKGEDESKVTLMTIHSAKGLEFPVVFVVGLEEGLLPNFMSGQGLDVIEEERRLCYVAITRAEDLCFLTYSLSRYRYGKIEYSTPSRFLDDIKSEFLKKHPSPTISGSFVIDSKPRPYSLSKSPGTRMDDYENNSPVRRVASVSGLKHVAPSPSLSPRPVAVSSSRPSVPSTGNAMVSAGQVIEHERFGVGRVLQVEGTGENTKATVEFQHSGRKQLLLRFARFKVVE